MLYLISGRDEYRRDEFVGQLKARMHALVNGEHNIVELASPVSLPDLASACDVTPFLCEKRMVIVRGGLAPTGGLGQRRGGARGQRGAATSPGLQDLIDYLPRLPETTHLVLVEEDEALLRPLAPAGSDVFRRSFPLLTANELPAWIAERTRRQGIQMAPEAARALAELGGSNLRLLDQEISKLATATPLGGAITLQDVHELVPGAAPDIFALHDSIAEGRVGTALATAHGLLEAGAEPVQLFAQATALIRRLLVAKELIRQRRSLAQEGPSFGLSTSRYAQDRLGRQADRLALSRLIGAYQTLLEMDLAIKTGRIEADLALELTVAELAGLEAGPAFSSGEEDTWGSAI